MIPVKLRLRNFMCYRGDVPPLSFEGIHTACISGDNGNGKSALVDAITWALWGRTRARADDELVHSAEAEMDVEFDFRVGQQLYRVLRKHSKPRRQSRSGQTALELQIASEKGFKPINGETLTQTQQKLSAILHMDYETFINSAFLRQGHADEFTTKRPAQRKEVLASILGLSLYDDLEEQARELVREKELQRGQLESALAEIEVELARKPDWEAEHKAALVEIAQVEALLKELESKLNSLRQQKETLEARKAQLAELDKYMNETAQALGHWKEQISQHQTRIVAYESLLAQRAGIEDGYSQLVEVRQTCTALEQKFRQVAGLETRGHKLEMAIEQKKQELLSGHRLAQSRIGELEQTYQELPRLRSELEQLESQQAQLAAAEEELRQRRQVSQESIARIHSLDMEQQRLRHEVAEIEEKLNLLSGKSDATCPLCESDLGAEGRRRIEEKYHSEKAAKLELIKVGQSSLIKIRTEVEAAEKQIKHIETKLNADKAALQSRLGALGREIAQAEEAGARLSGERGKLVEIEQHTASRDYAAFEERALHGIAQELAALDYSPQQHEEARSRLSELEQFEEPKRRLDEAVRLVGQEKEALSRAEAAYQEQAERLKVGSRKQQDLAEELQALPRLENSLNEALLESQNLAARQKQSQESVGSARARLERCTELESKKREKQSQLASAAGEESIYRELAKAFGKGGIQAQLIEMALPELEIEANRLLSRMTDNRMNIKFDTQRESKKGDPIETLDINICDELGHTRSYEMFSGGEAFRIDFAIRIALSRLLARRAGAPLPTLIIDEGFGTQDASGIEKLKEAINSIQDDFEKVLVITHIDELKDAFPARIDVVRTAEGSTISLN